LAPLSGINQNAGRRAAVVATAGGILVSTFAGAASAQAAPVEHSSAKLNTVDLGALTTQAREALEPAPVVTVAPDAQVQIESVTAKGVAAVKVTPGEHEAPAPSHTTTATTRTTTTSASRSTERVAGVPASAYGSKAASIALRYVGVRYVVGGASPSGFDCSGLVSYVYAQLGIDLPHQSAAIYNSSRTTTISRSQAQAGDVIYSPGHVSIYLGNGMQVEASRPGGWDVAVRSIWQSNPIFLRVS
jgi:cell wall-associated NlpC family hydrolase